MVPSTKRFCRAALLSAAAFGLAGATSHAATIVDDPFTDGGFTDGADPLDARWVKNNTGITLSVVNDTGAGTLNSNALRFAPGTSTFTGTVATLPGGGVTLNNVGDFVDVTFDFRVGNVLGNLQAVRFGFYDSLGTPAVDDNGASAADDKGYYATLGRGGTGNGHGLREETGGTNSILSGGDNTQLAGNSTGAGVTDTAPHGAGMRITLTATGINVQWSHNGSTFINFNDATPVTLSYDEFAIGLTEGTPQTLLVDNVVVTSNVPEPAAASLLAAGAAGLLVRRCRRGGTGGARA